MNISTSHILDPQRVKETLSLPFIFGKSIDPITDKTKVHKDSFVFRFPQGGYFFFSHQQPNSVTIHTEKGEGDIYLNEISRVIYKPEWKRLICEVDNTTSYTILEIEKVPDNRFQSDLKGNLKKPPFDYSYFIHVNMPRKFYEENYKQFYK